MFKRALPIAINHLTHGVFQEFKGFNQQYCELKYDEFMQRKKDKEKFKEALKNFRLVRVKE